MSARVGTDRATRALLGIPLQPGEEITTRELYLVAREIDPDLSTSTLSVALMRLTGNGTDRAERPFRRKRRGVYTRW